MPPWRDEKERFWEKVEPSTTTSYGGSVCLEWRAAINVARKGYGLFNREGRTKEYAHRFAWIILRGPIPSGMQIDHLCKNRICVNVDHLEVVTPRENSLRVSGWNTGFCHRGHELNEQNVRTDARTGHRRCRPCDAYRMRCYRAGTKVIAA